ncbi:MAG: PQQ-dependent sugar dehydrogenase [Fibrobacterota bacterium]|nr:PQQ-dependent sugar dehydrogenase [Fibrobacterota bacterium]
MEQFMRNGNIKKWVGLVLGLGVTSWAADLGTHKGCAATDLDFKTTQIFQGPAPKSPGNDQSNSVLKLAFDKQPGNVVDVYFIQKEGVVNRYNGSTKTVDVLGKIDVDTYGEYGLVGIAVDPDFKNNRYIYVTYSFIEPGTTYSFRISRITVGPGLTGKLDMSSEKILIKIPRFYKTWHSAGAMQFDAYGDLYCSIGDNNNTEITSGNTADFRGSILRIHPDNSARGYSIPKGNFAEVFAAHFRSKGNATVAAQYEDTSKVKAEIYIKGTRNAYSLAMDPVRRWLAFGDVGPDQLQYGEEYNMIKSAVEGGWPYYAGRQNMGAGSSTAGPASGPYGKPVPLQTDPNAMMNNLPGIMGVVNLPPNHNPIYAKQAGCAISGPILRYDGSNPSPTQFPPQLDHKWLITDCTNGGYAFILMTFDAKGDTVLGGDNKRIFLGENFHSHGQIVDAQQGPDGSLYLVDYGTGGIYRTDYTGTCKDPTLLADKTGCTDPIAKNYDASVPVAYHDPRLCNYSSSISGQVLTRNPLVIDGKSVTVSLSGGYEIKALDVKGRIEFAMSGEGPNTFVLPALKHSGVYRLQITSRDGVFSRKMLSMTP